MLETSPRLLAAALAAAVSLAGPFATASAAEAAADGDSCELITLEELNALGPLKFSAQTGAGRTCSFPAASGSHFLVVSQQAITFDLLRNATPESEEFLVGDRPAIAVDDFLFVGLDDGTLSVALELPDAAELGGLGRLEYSIDVAEVVLAGIGSDAADGTASTLVPPPEVAGVEWRSTQGITSAAEMMEGDEQQQAVWQPLLDAVGADATELFLISANASNADGRVGPYSAIQIIGADEATLRTAIIDWFRAVGGSTDIMTADITLGGKDVTSLSADGEIRAYIYHDGDTIHTVTMDEEDAAKVLEVLP